MIVTATHAGNQWLATYGDFPGTNRTLAKEVFTGSLEPVHDLLSSSARNARWMNCKLVLSLR
ncbi:hypothetical protein, partial [Xanthomonas oryzae]|uniref:hypothetical protein n=1 Tax=Xanthomonas oryzae TaxID=347 RepID=UPI001C4A17B7